MLRSIVFAGLLVFAVIAGAAAQSGGGIEVGHVWARATPGGAKTAAVYMTLDNKGADADRLVAVSTPVAGMADVHSTTTENGVMRMRPAGPLEIKPGAAVEMKPGGYHVMLMQLKGPLVAGQSFPVNLTFEKAGTVQVTATVEKAGAMGPGAMPGMKM